MDLFIELAKILLEASFTKDFPIYKFSDSVKMLFVKNKSIISSGDRWIEVCLRSRRCIIRFSNPSAFQSEIEIKEITHGVTLLKNKIEEFSNV